MLDNLSRQCVYEHNDVIFQVAALQEERQTLVSENEKLCERLNQADSLEDPR